MTAERLTIPIRWLGSKVRMRKRILSILDEVPRELYVEPFGGAGAIFFGKEPERSVYNDKNRPLSFFFFALKDEKRRRVLERIAERVPVNAETFYALRSTLRSFPDETNEQKEFFKNLGFFRVDPFNAFAFAFFYVHNFTFGAVPNGPWGGETLEKTYRRNLENLDAFGYKLCLTSVYEKDFRVIFDTFDDEKTLFYCDPPYIGTSSKNYGRGGGPTWDDYDTKALVERLATLKGSAVLSCYDDELYRPLLSAGYERRTFDARTTCARKKEGRALVSRLFTSKRKKRGFYFDG